MDFRERMRYALTRTGKTQDQIAKEVGVSRQTIVNWLTGNRGEPKSEYRQKLSAALQTTETYLFGSDEYKFQLVDVVDSEEKKDDDAVVEIPEYKLEFSCGSGCDAPSWVETSDEPALYSRSFFHRLHVNPKKCRRVKACGDSMEPLIHDGDHVMFVLQPEGTPINDGDVYAMSFCGSLKIKRLYQKANGDVIIRSDNPKYEDEIVPSCEVNDTIRIYGVVIERSGLI